jgi:hypothetical protein
MDLDVVCEIAKMNGPQISLVKPAGSSFLLQYNCGQGAAASRYLVRVCCLSRYNEKVSV